MLQLPFFQSIGESKRVLIAGAGGGYDIFCGLPLYFGLKAAGCDVWLANLSFTALDNVHASWAGEHVLEVNADSWTQDRYFPEGHLARWFRSQSQEVSIYCFRRTGVKPLRQGYEELMSMLNPDTIILVDGGTDSLMRGDEDGLGTPHEDMASIAAVHDMKVPKRILACIGFGVDAFHGVCHAHYLEAVADIARRGGYLGALSVLSSMPEAQKFRSAAEYVFEQMQQNISIVSSSILSAIEGHYGDHHSTPRTRGSRLYINPLMSLYWFFSLDIVADRILYLDELKETSTYFDVGNAIGKFRRHLPMLRLKQQLPM